MPTSILLIYSSMGAWTFSLFFLMVLEIKHRALWMLINLSKTEVHISHVSISYDIFII
jgi:hypothetical protein